MFDVPNIAAFQQIFHFLLCQVDKVKVGQEMRDCWPVLDKKQEVEFRRKVVGILKEWQKENPTDLPYVNPSLLQSPGGRKFKSFLHTFSTWVMNTVLDQKEELLSRPGGKLVSSSRRLQISLYDRLVKRQEECLDRATNDQREIVDLEKKAKEYMEIIASNYKTQKNEVENVREELKLAENLIISEFPGFATEDVLDKERLLLNLQQESSLLRETETVAHELGAGHIKHWEVLNKMLDESRPRPTLELSKVALSSLELTYKSLTATAMTTAEKVLNSYPATHLSVTGLSCKEVNQQVATLEGLTTQLEAILQELRTSVNEKLAKSQQIDWANSVLAPPCVPNDDQKDKLVLLPPTPSLLPQLAKTQDDDQEVCKELSLNSPVHVPVIPAIASTSCTTPLNSRSEQMVQRRFPRKLTPDQSPLLRQSLLQSTIKSSEELLDDRNSGDHRTAKESFRHSRGEHSDTKESITIFSPVLSSTLAPQCQVEDTVATIPRVEVCDTASKIDHYRKVLRGIQPTTQTPLRPARARLAEVWESARKSLSPRLEARDISLDLDVATRLDQLMDSLTLSESGNLSMESPLLSPFLG